MDKNAFESMFAKMSDRQWTDISEQYGYCTPRITLLDKHWPIAYHTVGQKHKTWCGDGTSSLWWVIRLIYIWWLHHVPYIHIYIYTYIHIYIYTYIHIYITICLTRICRKKTSEQVTVLFCDIDGFEVVECDLRIIWSHEDAFKCWWGLDDWMVVPNILYVHLYLGKWSNLID